MTAPVSLSTLDRDPSAVTEEEAEEVVEAEALLIIAERPVIYLPASPTFRGLL